MQKNTAPDTRSECAGARGSIGCDKGTKIRDKNQRRILELLQRGGTWSVADITLATHFSDPRSTIRELRHKGHNISDIWCKASTGGRYKRYFIKSGHEHDTTR